MDLAGCPLSQMVDLLSTCKATAMLKSTPMSLKFRQLAFITRFCCQQDCRTKRPAACNTPTRKIYHLRPPFQTLHPPLYSPDPESQVASGSQLEADVKQMQISDASLEVYNVIS